MKVFYGTALISALVIATITFTNLKLAHGELVFEDNPSVDAQQTEPETRALPAIVPAAPAAPAPIAAAPPASVPKLPAPSVAAAPTPAVVQQPALAAAPAPAPAAAPASAPPASVPATPVVSAPATLAPPAPPAQVVAPAPSPITAPSPVTVPATPAAPPTQQPVQAMGPVADATNGSQVEALKRQRIREEMKNEDVLTQRLEELRLKDELKRTDQILGTAPAAASVPTTPAAPQANNASQAQQAPAAVLVPSEEVYSLDSGAETKIGEPAIAEASISATAKNEKLEGHTRLTINPRGGISSFMGSGYRVDSRYAVGLALGLDISQNIALEAGYTYATYGISGIATSYNPYYTYGSNYSQNLDLSDNIFNLGGRINFLDLSSRLRPFIGGGLAYRKAYINYDDRTVDYFHAMGYSIPDVEMTGLAGYADAGVEIQLIKQLSLVGMFRYFNMFSAKQVGNGASYLPNGSYNGGYYYGYGDVRNSAANAISRNAFYQLSLGLSVGF